MQTVDARTDDDREEAAPARRVRLPATVALDLDRTALDLDRTVTIGAPAAPDARERSADDRDASARGENLLEEVLSCTESDPARHAALVARDPTGRIVAAAGYRVFEPRRAVVVGTVDRRYRGLGLGTFLLRRLAEAALDAGILRFRVEVTAGDRPLADLLRDCGLRSHWDLGRVTHVDLELRARRPGWATPECPAIAPATGATRR